MTELSDSVLRTFLDVVVHQGEDDEWIALSREAAVVGETLVLDVMPTDDPREMPQRFPVYVIDSQPVIINGDVRHRIRLQADELPDIFFEQPMRPA